MGMVVRTNTMALNAYRQLGMNNSAVSKSLEKLSSGFRINRAGDDAAGLAISEKMKAQIKGLETASSNAQDGISLIQTAEGNLNEVHDMLNRLVELSTKSANGTYTQTERDALQDEVNALLEEVDRISQSANFNGTRLLDGTMGLNANAFEILDGVAGSEAGVQAIKDASFSDVHAGTPSTTLKKPMFSADFADVKVSGGSVTLTSEGSNIEVWDATANNGNGAWKAYSFDKDGAAFTGEDVAGDLKGKQVRIGKTVYNATATNAGNGDKFGVKFEYAGYTEKTDADSAVIADANGDKVAGIQPKGDLVITTGTVSFTVADAQKDNISEVKFTDAAAGDVKLKYEDVTAAKGSATASVASATGTKIETNTTTDVLNGKSLTIKLAATGDNTNSATLDGDGNLTVTIAANAALTADTDFKASFNTALGTLGDTGTVADAWKAIVLTMGTGYVAPTAGADATEIATFTLANGVTADGYKVTATVDGKTSVATGTGALANDAKLDFKGDFTGSLKVLDAAEVEKLTTGNDVIGSNPTNPGVAGTATGRVNCPAYMIQDGQAKTDGARSGITLTLDKDMIAEGNTLKIQNLEVTFVQKGKGKGTGNEIELDYTTGGDDDRLAQVTEALSKLSTTDFTIGRANDPEQIEIEEKVPTGTATLKNYTDSQLKGMFSLKTSARAATNVLKIKGNVVSGDTIRIGDKAYTFVTDGKGSGTNGAAAGNEVVIGADTKTTLNNLKAKLGAGFTATVDETAGTISIANSDAKKPAPFITGGGLTLQIGDTADKFNKMTVAVADMSTKGLGLKNLQITSESLASNAIDKIKTAINTVSTARAGMGALQNRLEHTINNLDVAVENLSAANSRIRDTDMAKEMMNYTKMNVLVQSAQAMLAQANQQPQSVLQLLQ